MGSPASLPDGKHRNNAGRTCPERGAYTTVRTVDRKAVFELSMHCSRMHQTASAILSQGDATGEAAAGYEAQARSFFGSFGPEGLKPLIRSEISTGLDFLQSLEGDAT